MSETTVELLIDAPDRQTLDTFAVDLATLLAPEIWLGVGQGPEIPADAAAPPRYVVWALARGDAATEAAVGSALARLGVKVDTGAAAEALGMTVVRL